MTIFGVYVSALDAVLLSGIAVAFVAGSACAWSLARDRRASRVRFRQQITAAKASAPTMPIRA